jgi:hypothetical protein
MSKLIIKFPTRNRPEKFKKVLQLYIDGLSGKHDVKFVITMDDDDQTMNNEEIKSWLNSLPVNIKYNYGNSKTKIQAVNADLENEEADVLLVASDDMIPQIQNYDDIIFQSFNHVFPNFDGAIKFNDGLRNDDLMTLCVMGWPLYKQFGYIYHPEYTSVYADTEQTLVLKKIKKYAISDICIIRHAWTPAPWDELHARNENSEMYSKDKEVFDRHMKEILV